MCCARSRASTIVSSWHSSLSEPIPFIKDFALLIVPALLFMFLFIGGSAIPSVSLEGKALWVIRTLPVKSKDVLMMKEYFQIILTLIPSVFFAIAASAVLSGNVWSIISMTAFAVATSLFSAAFSLYMGLIKADVNWTNETVAIKSNIGVLLVMLVGYALMIGVCGIYYLIVDVLEINLAVEIYVSICTVLMLALFVLLNKVIGNKGVKKFESLN